MKGKNKYIFAVTAAAGLLLIILDSQTAMAGAKTGIDLCIRTVIPALFPFFFLTGIITGTLSDPLGRIFRPISKICKIPEGAESILVLGLLGGYPIGAQAVYNGYAAGYISKNDARRMISFGNNPGPAFIFGMVGCLFDKTLVPWIIWCIIIVTAIITAIIQPTYSHFSCKVIQKIKTNHMETAIKAMAKVCGWVIIFRILITIFSRWFLWMLPAEISIIIIGFMELSNGVASIVELNNPVFQFCCTCAMLSFGGICVCMQTAGVAGPIISRQYLFGKLFQTSLTIPLSYLISLAIFHEHIHLLGTVICALSLIFASCMGYYLRKNNTGNYSTNDI